MGDFVRRFNLGELAYALRFKRVVAGAELKLKLAGSMADGTPFAATDCVVVIGDRSQKDNQGRHPR